MIGFYVELVFQQTLNTNEVNELLNNLKNHNELFSTSILCLGKGSNYIIDNPYFPMDLLKFPLDDDELWSVFLIIEHQNISFIYLEQLFFYGNYINFFKGNTTTCFLIVDILNNLLKVTNDTRIVFFFCREI